MTEEQVNLFRLIDNKTSEYSDWDFEKLKNELSTVDLTLDKNQILLERFELTAEVFDIEPEQAEIKIPAFNFMSVKENKSKDKKTTVSTIYNAEPSEEVDENDNEIEEVAQEKTKTTPKNEVDTADKTEQPNEAPKKSKAVLPFCQFRFGDVAFFISQIELDRLNVKYSEYIDSGAILKGSFANYLLEEVENSD